MSMTKQSSEYFEQVAGHWDELRAGYFGKAVREAAIAKAYLRPEWAVADIGAGTGFIAAGLAPLVRRVYAVDGSEAMLEVARKNLAEFENVEFHTSAGETLPFEDETLDAVFANMYLHHTADPLKAIREMVRVLRPGGRLVITDEDTHPYAWLKEEMADVWQGFERSQVRRWFVEAGLVNVIVDCTGESCCAQSTAQTLTGPAGQEARISIFVATGTRRMSRRESVQESYAGIARSGSSCGCSSSSTTAQESCCAPETSASADCCGGSSSSSYCGGSASVDAAIASTGYSLDELSSAPKEAADISLGCGNPFAFSRLQAGEVVLDIGSGGGLDAFLAAQKVGPAGRAIGVDMTPEMLERARASAERNGIANVEFRQGYAEALPVGDGEIDVIISNCVINLAEDKGVVFGEAFRALKPGGRLEVSDVVTSGQLPFELQMDAAGWAECVSGALPEAEYADLIRQAGFESVTIHRSPSMGSVGGVKVYSAVVSAKKP